MVLVNSKVVAWLAFFALFMLPAILLVDQQQVLDGWPWQPERPREGPRKNRFVVVQATASTVEAAGLILMEGTDQESFYKHYAAAAELFDSPESSSSREQHVADVINLLKRALTYKPNDPDANQFLGTMYVETGDLELAAHHMRRATLHFPSVNALVVSNLVEVLRRLNRPDEALTLAMQAIQTVENERHGDASGLSLQQQKVMGGYAELLYNTGFALMDRGNNAEAARYFTQAAHLSTSYNKAWRMGAQAYLDSNQGALAEALLEEAMKYHPDDHRLVYLYGCSFHFRGRIDEAIEVYKMAELMSPNYLPALANIAAAYQGLGQVATALQYYEMVVPYMMNDAGVLNNYGALLGIMNRKEEEIQWLKKALDMDPNVEHALVNLGGHYQDDGSLEEAEELLTRALEGGGSGDNGGGRAKRQHLRLRIAALMSPIAASWSVFVQDRVTVERNLLVLAEQALQQGDQFQPQPLDSNLDRIHFYIQYHGVNDRYLQELFSLVYARTISDLNEISVRFQQPTSLSSLSSSSAPSSLKALQVGMTTTAPQGQSPSLDVYHDELRPHRGITPAVNPRDGQYWMRSPDLFAPMPVRKVRIAFISKFFGVFEPHGALLDGIIKYLPRNQFYVIALPVARTDGKPLAPDIAEFADMVHEISLTHRHAIDQISAIDIDILVFADVLCEPMNHFLAHMRLARIQVAFWGNPITSASEHMDYFVSGDSLEHPFRTRLDPRNSYADPYKEQVVLVGGQGIWYFRPKPPEEEMRRANISMSRRKLTATREEFGLRDDWFIFFCPQSTFKIHPLYDRVLAAILKRLPNAHLVVTGGRRQAWTDAYKTRLSASIGPENADRFHVIERVSSERFIALCKISDVMLHPFPFDGSRTSADAITAGIPYITLPTEYLKGRMGAAFYRTMNIPDLVARNASEYVDIAVRLHDDPAFLQHMRQLIVERGDLIWEDMESPFGWAQFFSVVAGLPSPSWEAFVQQTGRDVRAETALRNTRRRNMEAFERTWGPETWLLNDGIAILESYIDDPAVVPQLFNDWNSGLGRTGRDIADSQLSSFEERKQRLLAMTAAANSNSNDSVLRPLPQFLGGSESARRLKSWKASQFGSDNYVDPSIAMLENLQTKIAGKTTVGPASMRSAVHTGRKPPIEITITGGELRRGGDGTRARAASAANSNSAASTISVKGSPQNIKLTTNPPPQSQPQSQPPAQPLVTTTAEQRIDHSNVSQPFEIINPDFDTFRELIRSGRIEDAHQFALLNLFSAYQNTPMFNLEFGSLQVFRGNYREGFEYCQRAALMVPESRVSFGCMGVASTHLLDESTALSSLQKSWELSAPEVIHRDPLPSKIFALPRTALDFNLFSALRTFKKFDVCAKVLANMAGIPANVYDIMLMVKFALVEWSPSARMRMKVFELRQRRLGLISLAPGKNLFDELARVRQVIGHIINPAMECVVGLGEKYPGVIEEVAKALVGVLTVEEVDYHPYVVRDELLEAYKNTIGNKPGIVLLTQYFQPSNEAAAKDINDALAINLANPMISEVAMLNEHPYNFSQVEFSWKIKQYVLSRRPTFADIFELANQAFANRTVIIANSDIYFDKSLVRLGDPSTLQLNNTVLALLKWRQAADQRGPSLSLRTDSQDAWIFQPPLHDALLSKMGFYMGAVRCDNRLADILFKAGYHIINPAFAIHAIELQSFNRQGGLYDLKGSAVGDGRNVFLSDKFVF